MCTIPPHDSSSKERSQNNFFNQHLNVYICHPSELDFRTLTNITDESIRKGNYSNQINTAQCHVHYDYCKRNKGKCEKENAKNATKVETPVD